MTVECLPEEVLNRKAVVYVRQSSKAQVQTNLESQRRQYELVDAAKRHGFKQIEVIDDDLGRSASGTIDRPGFDKLVAEVCASKVGAVLCADASRLARNGRDWHHLLELCGLAGTRVIDTDGVYDPRLPNDRLLLGMKGSISEFELGIIRARMLDAKHAKALRGELRTSVPIGYVWDRDADGPSLDPDLRVQEAVRLIFARFRQLGSARQVMLSLAQEKMTFPRPTDGKTLVSVEWAPIRYRSVIATLKNPFYAGAYVYGKTEKHTGLDNGRLRTTYKHRKPFDQWEVIIQNHHEGYIEWSEFERNQKTLASNNYAKAGGVKSGRGGRALLPGVLLCGRCGRRLAVAYSGRPPGQPIYRCERPNQQLGRQRCLTIGAKRVDAAIAAELLQALSPMAIEAALQAERQYMEGQSEQQHMVDLELQQARYEAKLAERRYAACDPDNRLIAAQLEKSWETALQRVQACETRLAVLQRPKDLPSMPDLAGLAEDLQAAWNAPEVTMRTRQQLLRALISDIVVGYEESSREILLTIHWRGGQHSQLRVTKPKTGEHSCRTPDEAVSVIRSMAARWPDEEIAATLNRMGLPTGQGKAWNARRVASIRSLREIPAYSSADKNGEWVTMTEAAKELGVTNHQIRRLIKEGVLPATQVVPCAPFQIRARDLRDKRVTAALSRRGRPRRLDSESQTSIFSDT